MNIIIRTYLKGIDDVTVTLNGHLYTSICLFEQLFHELKNLSQLISYTCGTLNWLPGMFGSGVVLKVWIREPQ